MSDPVVKVADVMQTSLHTINGLASVQDAIGEMRHLAVSSLIIERRQPGDEYGLLTVRDIAREVVSGNKSAARTSVYQVMTKPSLTLLADMNVKYAIRLMSQFAISRALVTRDDELVGLVTLRDMVIGYVGEGELQD